MKARFETFFRCLILFLLFSAAFGIWAGAQTNTNVVQSPKPQQAPLAQEVTQELDHGYFTFGLDRVPAFREIHIWKEPLWRFLAFVVYLLFFYYLAKLLDLITFVWLKKLARKTETRIDDLLIDMLRGPVKIIAFAVLLRIALNIFDWPESEKLYFSKGLILVVAAALTYVSLKLVDLLLHVWRLRAANEDKRFNDQLFSVIRKSLKAFVVIVAILVTASNVGINITAAITSLSIGGLAVGLAAQDTLANLFGAVSVFADKPFQVGDAVRIDTIEGTVEAVGLRSTKLRNPDGHLVAIPNKTVANSPITNLSTRPTIRTVLNFPLAVNLPSEKIQRALQILDDVYRKNPMTKDLQISFNQFTSTSINITVIHWWKGTDFPKYLAGMQEMNLAVKQQFDREEIRFALPRVFADT